MKFMGLTSEQVELSRKEHGTNALTIRESESFWAMLKESLSDTWLKILMAALALEVIFYGIGRIWPDMGSDDWFSAVAIFVVIIAVSLIGTYVNYKQDRGAKALQQEASQILVKVYRNGQLIEISIDDVVFNDFVVLQPGDKIPADGILIEGSIMVDQAALNGESREAKKKVLGDNPIPSGDDLFTELKCFRGSVVTSGSAIMKVTEVGDSTVLGGINVSLQEKVETKTPSEEKLDRLAKNIGTFGYIGGSAAAIIYLIMGLINAEALTVGTIAYLFLNSLVLGVSIIVMAVPEGLPLMNILVEALNVGKMLKAHIFVRNPQAIETAGYLTHVFTDKTGTLTEGKMSVSNVITGDGSFCETFSTLPISVKEALIVGIGVNNDSAISANGKSIGSNDTDRALMGYLYQNGIKVDKNIAGMVAEPFNSKVKFAAITLPNGDRYLKGAPEVIMNGCTHYLSNSGKVLMTEDAKSNLQSKWEQQTSRAMRVIAVVMESNGEKIFIALISIRDDVRSDVKKTVTKMQKAGIQVTMVTGDVYGTATAIAREAGLITSDTDLCITHDELAKMTDDEVIVSLPCLKVVARAVPSDKERLVKLSQSTGAVVGMTGDGVNDAAALHKADVGFAMGSGTEVAKEAGDIIILNDSLTSIADAILYGRTMAKSVKKFITFQLTVNVSTVFTAILGLLLGWSEVFTIVQILWINMIMDTLAAIAFGQEPPRDRFMKEKPISRDADILTGYIKSSIFTGGLFITALCMIILSNLFGICNLIGIGGNELTVRTFMFSTFIFAIIWNSFNARTDSLNLFEHIKENKNFMMVMSAVALLQVLIIQVGGEAFGTTSLDLNHWLVVIAIAFLIIPLDLIRKGIFKKVNK